jgi:MFS family permease
MTLALSETGSSPSDVMVRRTAPSGRTIIGLFTYVIVMLVLFNIGAVGVTGVPMQFVLKDTLKFLPTQMSVLGFLTDIPLFVGFLFGFLRDRWHPFGLRDRGYFLFLPPLMAAANLLLYFGAFTYKSILVVSLIGGALGIWLGAATKGLTTRIAQKNGMTGRLSVVMLVIPRLVGMASSVIGGRLAHTVHEQHLSFLISAFLCLPMMAVGFWKPRSVFDTGESNPAEAAISENTVQALKRLLRCRVIYLPALILFLWSFAPGWGTPLFFYLTNTVKLSEAAYGNSQALLPLGLLFASLSYSFVCYRLQLKGSLYAGTLLGVLGCPLFLLIHTPLQADVITFLAGVSLGIAVCAFEDLMFRCCPRGLEGAAFLFVGATAQIAGDTSDIFGSWLYQKGGFSLALVVSTLFTALIFAVLPFVPAALLKIREGEPIEDIVEAATILPESHVEPLSRSLHG